MQLTNLTSLNLQQNYSQKITDASIAIFTSLTRLYIEPYRNPMITDRSLNLLTNLRVLNNQQLTGNEPPRLQNLKSDPLLSRSPPHSPIKPRNSEPREKVKKDREAKKSKEKDAKKKRIYIDGSSTDDWSDVTTLGGRADSDIGSSSDCAQQ